MLQLPWGNDLLSVPLPSGWRLLGQFQPVALPPARPPDVLCRAALARPIGAAPLATRDLKGKRVLLVSDDHSRPTPVHSFFTTVRDALVQAGAAPEQMEILFALGTHRPMTTAEAEAKIGRENLARHRWQNHNAFDAAGLVQLGTTRRGTPILLNRLLTEVDLVVTLGAIEPHVLLGFSGGYKTLLPGCAGATTSGHNHLHGVCAEQFNYVGSSPETSPMRLNLEEGGKMLGTEVFIVNAIPNAAGQIVDFFCGDPCLAFRAGASFVRQHSEMCIAEQADVVITNSRPFDSDLRQGMKCFGHTLTACRPGGLMLGFLHCRNGVGDVPLPSWTVPYAALRPLLHAVGRRHLHGLLECLRPHDPVEQKFLALFGLQMLHRNHLWFYSDHLEPTVGARMGIFRQHTSVDGMIAAAVRKVGPHASVAVFPIGGATYSLWPGHNGSAHARASEELQAQPGTLAANLAPVPVANQRINLLP
jgi:nickel-dependent lactate racemase